MKIKIKPYRNSFPLLSSELISVQPLSAPSGNLYYFMTEQDRLKLLAEEEAKIYDSEISIYIEEDSI